MTGSTDRPAVLIARQPERAIPLCKLLEASGMQVVCEPVMELGDVDDDALADARQLLEEIDTYDRIVVVSAEAGRRAIDLLRSGGRLDAALRRSIYAVGSASAAQWRDVGAEVEVPSADSRSEALLQLPSLQRLDGERVLILCGVGGRDLIENALRSRGADVQRCELYQRRFRPAALDVLMTLETKPDVLLALSGFATRCLALVIQALDSRLMSRPLVVPGARVASAARDAGFSNVIEAGDVGVLQLVEAVLKAVANAGQT